MTTLPDFEYYLEGKKFNVGFPEFDAASAAKCFRVISYLLQLLSYGFSKTFAQTRLLFFVPP